MTFAERLKAARAEKGITQLRLSVDAGVASSRISQFETGGKLPTPEVLARIEKVLGVKLTEVHS